MPYTLWSRGRLLGHSELSFARTAAASLRVGEFAPTPVGERLMPVILGVGPALDAFYDLAIDAREDAIAKGEPVAADDWPESVRSTTEYADSVASQDELDSLCLELHDDAGKVVKTDWISLQDVERLAALGHEAMRRDAEELGLDFDDDDRPEPWEPEPAKYQIMVMLEGGDKLERLAARRRRQKKSDSDGI